MDRALRRSMFKMAAFSRVKLTTRKGLRVPPSDAQAARIISSQRKIDMAVEWSAVRSGRLRKVSRAKIAKHARYRYNRIRILGMDWAKR
jgi:hypothetical protein